MIKAARQEIARILPTNPAPIRPIPNKPKVILLLGVNGTGKTTSTAKLARYLQQDRHGVLLAAADTFRAAAIEQLGIWAKKLGVEMVRGQYNADPAAICYEAYQAAVRDNPPAPPKVEPYKTHLAYVRERRDDQDGEAILNEALEALRNQR